MSLEAEAGDQPVLNISTTLAHIPIWPICLALFANPHLIEYRLHRRGALQNRRIPFYRPVPLLECIIGESRRNGSEVYIGGDWRVAIWPRYLGGEWYEAGFVFVGGKVPSRGLSVAEIICAVGSEKDSKNKMK